jgi:NAD(P)H-hydrate epimerase
MKKQNPPKGESPDLPLPAIPARKRDAHKGDFGHVLIVAGSPGMTGAACLASMAALRAGAGLVTLATPQSLQPVAASQMMSVMTLPCRETLRSCFSEAAAEDIMNFAEKCDSVAVGPGIGRDGETSAMVRRLFASLAKPLVVDADGLNALAGDLSVFEEFPADRPTVLSPHPGEMARLCLCSTQKIQADRMRCAESFVRDRPVTLLLKGANTVVAEGEKTFVCETGNPGMASAGAGDVLTGIIAAFLAQGFSAFDAARLGAHIHGLAGDIAANEYGEISMTADDILGCLPGAFKEFTERRK